MLSMSAVVCSTDEEREYTGKWFLSIRNNAENVKKINCPLASGNFLELWSPMLTTKLRFVKSLTNHSKLPKTRTPEEELQFYSWNNWFN